MFDEIKKIFGNINKKIKEKLEYNKKITTQSVDILIPDTMEVDDINGKLIRFICTNSIKRCGSRYNMELWAGFIAFKQNLNDSLTKDSWIPVCFELQNPGKKLTTYSKKYFEQFEMFNMLKKIAMELDITKCHRTNYNFLGRAFITDDRLVVAINEPPKPNLYPVLDKLDRELANSGIPMVVPSPMPKEEVDAILGGEQRFNDIRENKDVKREDLDPFSNIKPREGITKAGEDYESDTKEVVNPGKDTMQPYSHPIQNNSTIVNDAMNNK